jgi:hypothetical protein
MSAKFSGRVAGWAHTQASAGTAASSAFNVHPLSSAIKQQKDVVDSYVPVCDRAPLRKAARRARRRGVSC